MLTIDIKKHNSTRELLVEKEKQLSKPTMVRSKSTPIKKLIGHNGSPQFGSSIRLRSSLMIRETHRVLRSSTTSQTPKIQHKPCAALEKVLTSSSDNQEPLKEVADSIKPFFGNKQTLRNMLLTKKSQSNDFNLPLDSYNFLHPSMQLFIHDTIPQFNTSTFRHKHKSLDISFRQGDKSNKKLFVCQQCLAVFARVANLDRHQQGVHEQARPFVCEACGQAFSRKDNLKAHFKKIHLQ